MEKAQTYYLDLQTLIPYLRDRSAILHTLINPLKSREISHGSLFLRQGKIVGCFLHSANGQLLSSGEEAYRALISSKKWEVRIETERGVIQAMSGVGGTPPPPPQPIPPAYVPPPPQHSPGIAPQAAPRRVRELDEALLATLSSQQRFILRTVFALVNGERTIEQIQTMLSISPRSVEEALTYLRDHFMIE